MNIDLSIHRLAHKETASLRVAQALVALRRQELELRIATEAAGDAEEPQSVSVATALRQIEEASDARSEGPGQRTEKLV